MNIGHPPLGRFGREIPGEASHLSLDRIRIAIVDDHALVRSGLRRLLELEPGFEVVGEGAAAEEAVPLVERLEPDVLILDLQMPGTGGLAAIETIRHASPRTRILVVTMHGDSLHVRSALSAGALGYLVKSAAPAELATAVRAVHANRRHFDPEIAGLVSAMDEARSSSALTLSRRELQVLAGLVRGHTNREIADLLGVGVKSVESYRARLRAKLGADTRADLVRIATDAGLVSE
jgi:two-component system response regulator NreC